jgi:anti-sigma factor RsiW
MESETIHELTAAYALDALSPEEVETYESHLADCARCRGELAELGAAATALAYGTVAPVPPAALRTRILDAAAAERANVVPLRRRPAARVLAAAAAVAACAAVGLGIWAASLHDSLSGSRSARSQIEAAMAVVGDPAARRVALGASRQGALYVTPEGRAALVVARLPKAPGGRTYEAWVIRGNEPAPAGLFDGGGDVTAVRLDRAVPQGARVAVTLERAGGSDRPTRPILFASSQA